MAKTSPESTYPIDIPSQAVSFDAEAFDELIRTQGVEFVHWRSMRCPVGMIDPNDVLRRPHDHHQNCSNGFVYTLGGTVTCGFLGNSSQAQFIDPGRMDGSTVQVVLPRFYDDKPDKRVAVVQFDRMYLKEESITVENWHTFEHNITGIDKLQFPVVHVVDLMDTHGNRYAEDVDFEVRGGLLHWGSRRPGIDPKTGKGAVCSARYSYRPFWYVKQLMHEVRVAQVEDDLGQRVVERMPQSVLLQRERFFEKEQNDPEAPNSDNRQHAGPPSGMFGPR